MSVVRENLSERVLELFRIDLPSSATWPSAARKSANPALTPLLMRLLPLRNFLIASAKHITSVTYFRFAADQERSAPEYTWFKPSNTRTCRHEHLRQYLMS